MFHILVIDDDPIQHKLTERVLNTHGISSGYSFYQSPINALLDITEAFFVSQSLPDLILIDRDMPEMTGWQFVDAFCEAFSSNAKIKTSIYMISSSLEESDWISLEKYSCLKGLFPKPISIKIFSEIMEQVI
ncbi:response regulator [Pedobacter sp. SYSU D00535]|uniref:response regulator n=1 Tax=Pedobacter sp. SYSU D00535 TaxID=2810308 RepID=UPI001A971FFF|nr:response regulator [Pedobacter sp. SYSU D00535]